MHKRVVHRRGAARARVAERPGVSWRLAALTALGVVVCGLSVARSQPVPEVVRPQSQSPTLPPSGPPSGPPGGPDAGTGGRPIPENGVIVPPVSGAGSTTVIRPPSVGSMPVIVPPGSPGGDRSVVPK